MPSDPMLPVPASETSSDGSLLTLSQRLSALPEEAVWLANFVSPRTQRTYQAAVQGFIAFHDLRSADELRSIGPSHLIAWREHLIQTGARPRTVQNRLAAVSSLFRHLCERQVAARNPV
ncbi:MAG TPA: phage integrase N-terminal SAM-like domain-containing protein, partial [Candidatus Competibacteraceae bacterium]|nr:phage integrase N-terminal SAM-like domain-containing protein [Candidatus Competibacteraceae bacterium]